MSPRIKFYIKQIPKYQIDTISENKDIEWALCELLQISSRILTGHAAINHLQWILGSVSLDDAAVIKKVLSKDMKIGMGTTQVSKIWKGLIEKTPYQGAKSFSVKLVNKILKGKAVSQQKLDGRYCNSILDNGLELVSRTGEPTVLTGAKFLDELTTLGDQIVFNGELTILGMNSKYDGTTARSRANGIVASLIDISAKREKRGEVETAKKILKFESKHAIDYELGAVTFQEALDSIVFTVWDVLTVDEYYDNKSTVPYEDRFEKLKNILLEHHPNNVQLVESRVVKTFEEVMNHFKEMMDRGLEGTILKSLEAGWKNTKPSYQCKIKIELDVDLVVTGFNYGTVGTKNENVISSFIAESSCGGLITRPQGLDEDTMQYITDNQEDILGSIIKVKCNGVTKARDGKNYALMYPTFLFIRDDKKEADSLDEILDIERAAIEVGSR